MKYLLDANVLSEPTKRRPHPAVVQWLRTHEDDSFTSILVLGEIERGIIRLPDSKRKTKLMAWLQGIGDKMEEQNRLLGVDRELMSRWAVMYNSEQVRTSRKPPAIDTILAATAELHGLTMVTRNMKDFPASLSVINPWEE